MQAGVYFSCHDPNERLLQAVIMAKNSIKTASALKPQRLPCLSMERSYNYDLAKLARH
jgi:hypothetical protein